jgi:lipid A oxidase
LGAAPAAAEVDLSFYGGWAGAPDAGVTLGGADEAQLEDGGQIGLRATWWRLGDFGVALDYSRFELPSGTGEADMLSFSGLDTLTVSGVRRWRDQLGPLTPYVGAGVGIGLADVEDGSGDEVAVRGPTVSWVAGASVPLSESWSVFGEYEGTYTDLEGEARDGRSLAIQGVTNAVNLGVSFSF